MATDPIDSYGQNTAPRLAIAPFYKDPQTGATYVHQDLYLVQDAWEEEEHIGPMKATERFGDVESFVDYVKKYGSAASLVTWNSQGLQAVLDYAASADEVGRRQWTARHPFQPSREWLAWTELANGKVAHKAAVERIEDLAEDISDPSPADLANLLRSLRASVNANASAELRPDGTTNVSFAKDTTVKSGAASVELPSSFRIVIPVFRGHTDEGGRPVRYGLQVRLRVSADDAAHLAFRFSLPDAARVLEDVYADRVKMAAAMLGDSFKLLRAAD